MKSLKCLKCLEYTCSVLIVALLFSSCESFIDLQPLDQISANDYWKSTNDLKNYTLQFYPAFVSYTEMVHAVANSDDMFRSNNLSDILNGNRSTRTGNWRGEWAIIRNVNIFFDNYRKCQNNFNEYQHYVGEVHFFRAWFYFNMLKQYGDLPWYSTALQLDSEELMNPRAPRTLIADSILMDLDKAIMYLDDRASAGNTRINKEAALAFKTRVALYEGSWQKYHANDPFGTSGADPSKYFRQCVEASEELINGGYRVGIYSTGNPDEDYFKLFGFDDMSGINEVLLYKAFNAADGFGNATQAYIIDEPNSKGVTWDLVSSYLAKDGTPYDYLEAAQTVQGNDFLLRLATNVDSRFKSTVWIPGDLMSQALNIYFVAPNINAGVTQLCPTGFQVKKSGNPLAENAGRPWTYPGNTGLIIFRYGEVLLNYAEAKYELDQTVATAQLNLLRDRAGLPNFTVNSQNSDPNRVDYGYPVSDALYEIRRERMVELALEGLRDEDLMRWAAHALFKSKRPKGYPLSSIEHPSYVAAPLDNNGLIDYWANLLPQGYRFREGQDYLTSIPQDELTLNPNLIQNPGW